jgi:hypothetical protein
VVCSTVTPVVLVVCVKTVVCSTITPVFLALDANNLWEQTAHIFWVSHYNMCIGVAIKAGLQIIHSCWSGQCSASFHPPTRLTTILATLLLLQTCSLSQLCCVISICLDRALPHLCLTQLQVIIFLMTLHV